MIRTTDKSCTDDKTGKQNDVNFINMHIAQLSVHSIVRRDGKKTVVAALIIGSFLSIAWPPVSTTVSFILRLLLLLAPFLTIAWSSVSTTVSFILRLRFTIGSFFNDSLAPCLYNCFFYLKTWGEHIGLVIITTKMAFLSELRQCLNILVPIFDIDIHLNFIHNQNLDFIRHGLNLVQSRSALWENKNILNW